MDYLWTCNSSPVGYAHVVPAKAPEVRVDVVSAVVTALEVIVILGTCKVLAYRWHGHPLAQAYLTLF